MKQDVYDIAERFSILLVAHGDKEFESKLTDFLEPMHLIHHEIVKRLEEERDYYKALVDGFDLEKEEQ